MRSRFFVVLFFAVLLPGSAQAVCLLGTFSATALSFGTYSPGASTPAQSQATITAGCTLSLLTQATISLSTGSGTYANRTMKNGTNVLNYNLYLDSAHTMIWGDGTGGTVTDNFSSTLGVGSANFTVYGQVGSGQYPAAGFYSDVITVSIAY